MTTQDRQRWEPRHRQRRTTPPSASLRELGPAAAGALALDLACGQGRHTAALLAAGYSVVALDVSLNALVHVRDTKGPDSPSLLCVQGDVDDWPLREAVFDVVAQIDFLDRRLYPALRSALKPGGLLLVETFLDFGHRNEEGPSHADYVLARGELAAEFADFDIQHNDERDGATARATFLARKPAENRRGAATDAGADAVGKERTGPVPSR